MIGDLAGAAGHTPARLEGRLPLIGGLILIAAVLVGAFFSWRFVESERARELQQWQVRLGLVADSRAAAVEQWLDDRRGTLRDLVENASVQLYLTELSLARDGGGRAGGAGAESEYLANLLEVVAERDGYTAPVVGPRVNANVARVGQAGLGLTDADGNLLVATRDMPPMTTALREAMARAAGGEAAFVDIHENAAGNLSLGFVLPVFAVQESAAGSRVVGFAVGLRLLGDGFFRLLDQPGETAESAETFLVRKDGAMIVYLTPLRDGTPAMKRRLAADSADLAAARLVADRGGFTLTRRYDGTPVLATGRALAGAPWYLVRMIARDEALAAVEQRLDTILIVLFASIIGVAIAIFAVWRHGSSVRAHAMAGDYRAMAERLEEYSDFLRIVTDRQPTAIAVVDGEDRFTFANAGAAAGAGIGQEDMIGMRLRQVIGPVMARDIEETNAAVRGDGHARTVTRRIAAEENDDGSGERIVLREHRPLGESAQKRGRILIVEHDITELVVERERREQVMRDLVSTLVTLVDRRDPFSADQSRRVVEVAAAIATELEVDETTAQTIDIAARLMNLGKLLVPSNLLTKLGALDDDEKQLIRDSILQTGDLLAGLDFRLPVVETLREVQEHWDGTGYPNGREGERILIAARIIAVANAFVGMVSPRAYRSGMDFSTACDVLSANGGRRFDRRVVSALVYVLENRGGRERWAYFSEPPKLIAHLPE
ncbi:HD domain-containing phosphohydrolase [Oceanibacterium hippocampi]|uniref:Cyclic di-GMP phosphodiesterase response regulator RpfG n=1 Tax=Oceanibacterium hippocampi TaxID=745714 RepID=A0A1Y5S088_9PROT|nr:HD domain-containing phosphohydrolase [Oceanibacterium hippocampi]SLN28241.1 Cyclic di-GMP phosphodiesterase response regulator RpfG [Oceanibacterium hippocampi]